MRPRYSVSIGAPLGTAGPEGAPTTKIALGPDVALSWSTQIPGGDNGGSIGIDEDGSHVRDRRYAYLPQPVDSRPFGHVAVHVGSEIVSEGRVIGDEMPGGVVRGIEYEGYGIGAANDDWLELPGDSLTTSGRILIRSLASAAPLLAIPTGEDFVDPGVAHAEREFDGTTPAQVIERLATEGGGAESVPWLYTAYDRNVRFVPYAPPDEPEYEIPIDETVDIRRGYENLYTHLTLRHRTADDAGPGQVELANPAVEALLGFRRRKLMSGSVESSSAAIQFLQTERTRGSEPEIGVTVVRDYDRGLELAGGGERAVWLVRAGQWCRVRGLGTLLIEQTRFNAASGQLRIALGKPTLNRLAEILQRAEQAHVALRRKTDPVTQSPWRF